MISKETIDKVFELARVEEVIADFVVLKKSGANYKGLSPFTNEKTPSFIVSPAKQIWKDFSSGKGGNVIAFLMEHEHFNYPESIKYIANKYNIEIVETNNFPENIEKKNEIESLFIINKFAVSSFKENLNKEVSDSLEYLMNRGLSKKIIDDFDLGFCLPNRSSFYQSAKTKGFKDSYLEKTGLIIFNEEKVIDRFRDRVIFPIKSLSGRVLGFGGRTTISSKKTAKYINSPESEIYNKSKILYGIYESRQSIVKDDLCILVEGYMDVLQFHENGIKNVLASSGTSLTEDQITLISRLTSNIVLLFDGDTAGVNAALRSTDMILEKGLNVKICSFPEGEDPDSYVKDNKKDKTLDFINNNSKDFIEFKLSFYNEDLKDEDKRVDVIKSVIKSISKIPDRLKQEVYIKKCSQIIDIDESTLFNSLNSTEKNNSRITRNRRISKNNDLSIVKKEKNIKPHNYFYELEKQIITILLKYGENEITYEDTILSHSENGDIKEEKKNIKSKVFEKIFLDLQQDEIELAHPPFQKIYKKLIELYNNQNKFVFEKFVNELDSELSKIASDILIFDEKYSLHDWEKRNIYVKKIGSELSQLVNETLLNMRRYLIDERIKKLQEINIDKNKDELLQEVMRYSRLKKVLSSKLNRVV